MGKRSRQFEEEERFVRCEVCHEEIIIDYYLDREDVVCCEGCDSEFVIKSRNPTILFLLDGDYDDYYGDDGFEDDFFGKSYD